MNGELFKIASEFGDDIKGRLGSYYGAKIGYSPKKFVGILITAILLPPIASLAFAVYFLVKAYYVAGLASSGLFFVQLAILVVGMKKLNRSAATGLRTPPPVVYVTVCEESIKFETYYCGKEVSRGEVAYSQMLRVSAYLGCYLVFVAEHTAYIFDESGFILGAPDEFEKFIESKGVALEKIS